MRAVWREKGTLKARERLWGVSTSGAGPKAMVVPSLRSRTLSAHWRAALMSWIVVSAAIPWERVISFILRRMR